MELNIIPNLITLFRLLLVIPVVVAVMRNDFGIALMLFALASLSDGVDGFLARRFSWTSRFGAILDPIADKLLLVSTFMLLAYTGFLPVWLGVVVIGRDLIIFAGAISYHILFGEYELAPTLLGKLSTLLQFGLVLFVMVDQALISMSAQLLLAGIWGVFIVSSISGLDYVLTWGRKAMVAIRNQRKS